MLPNHSRILDKENVHSCKMNICDAFKCTMFCDCGLWKQDHEEMISIDSLPCGALEEVEMEGKNSFF